MEALTFVGVLYTGPRVGQNAVLGSLRTVFPNAGEFGAARPDNDGRLVFAANRPAEIDWWTGYVLDDAEIGRYVWLRRRDKIAQAVSWAMAAQTGMFRSDQDRLVDEPVYLRTDIDTALYTINDQERRHLRSFTGEEVLTIWYEDHVADDPSVAANMILDWWGFPTIAGPSDVHPVDSALKKAWVDRYWSGR